MKPITEEYLIELKFPKRVVLSESISYNEYSIRDNFNIYCYMDTSSNCRFWVEKKSEHSRESMFIVKCDTVQVFQKIYEALTGNKLVIRELVKEGKEIIDKQIKKNKDMQMTKEEMRKTIITI
ncbi:MAG: hypothetical protein V3V72_13545 [Ignavibacteriaceae bacterium]